MKNLKKIEVKIKNGNEKFYFEKKEEDIILLKFWQWAYSDIISNANRGKLAEFIVANALGINLCNPSDEWGPYDLETKEGIKIEIKTSSFIQTWNQKDYSNPNFGIQKTIFWDEEKGEYVGEKKRQSDFYIFCLLKEKKQDKINPLKLEQWEFYIVKTEKLNQIKENQKSIGLKGVQKIVESVNYLELKKEFYKQIK